MLLFGIEFRVLAYDVRDLIAMIKNAGKALFPIFGLRTIANTVGKMPGLIADS